MSVQPADIRRHMGRVLGDEARMLAELQLILSREAAVVRGDDPAAIENIGGARQQCIDALMQLDLERTATCRMLPFGEGRDGFERLLGWCDSGGSLQSCWQANLQSARRCKELNDSNGAVVALKLNHVQKLLAMLRGGGAAPAYGRQGLRVAGFAPRELGQA